MNNIPTMEFHILNFFRVKNDYATTVEMNADFERSGVPTGEPGFQKILDNGYLDVKRENGRFVYKLNNIGLARWLRLNNELEMQHVKPSVNIHGDVIGSVIGNQSLEKYQINPTVNISTSVPNEKPKKRSLLEILAWAAAIIGTIAVVWEFILKRFLNQP